MLLYEIQWAPWFWEAPEAPVAPETPVAPKTPAAPNLMLSY